MPRTARLEPLPPTPMERPPGRTPATRGRSRSHRGGTAELEDRRLTHRLTSGNLFRVGQTPRRALRLTQSIVGKLTDERLSRRETRPLSAGRLRPAAVRAGGTDSGGQVRVKDHARARKLPAGLWRCQAHRVAAVRGSAGSYWCAIKCTEYARFLRQ